MAQVIIVSNRLPVVVKKDKGKLIFSSSLGGVATGLSSLISGKRGNLWVGWPGIASDELTSLDKQLITNKLIKQNCVPVFLTSKQIDGFYNGYSNSVLWPLFHGLKLAQIKPSLYAQWWRSYRSINQLYSDVTSSLIESKSQIWIHDYLLMLMPSLLRSENQTAALGFFLHIPFPTNEALDELPEAKQLLSGLLGADLVGFHTKSYVENFLAAVSYFKLGEVKAGQVDLADRFVRVAEFPMGIDYEKFATAGKLKGVKTIAKSYLKKYRRMKIIVSVDRLDPSKGLVERLRAYRRFLELNPKKRGKVVFVMVAAPSRTSIAAYKNLSNRLGKLAKGINTQYGTDKWQPVDYINEPLPFEGVSALFQIADVAFIAPIRDGMNLTAKEFVASNQRGGVLILSQTAGAADELKDALIVDPKSSEALVEALDQALSMRRRELKRRLKRMRRHLSSHTVQQWSKSFVESLSQPLPKTPHLTRVLNRRLRNKLVKQYQGANKRLLLLDYDGSLVPFAEDYDDLKPPKVVSDLVKQLAKDSLNDVVIISGRNAEQLDEWFGKLSVSLVAEHGAAIKVFGHKWKTIEKDESDWKKLLLPSLQKYADLTPGAKVEVKAHSLVWHYRGASIYHAQKYGVIIKRALKPILKKYGLELVQGSKILEIKNPLINKGEAAKGWLAKGYDYILAVGDDATDEDLFAALPITGHSIKVGKGLTKAQYRVAAPKELLSLLKRFG